MNEPITFTAKQVGERVKERRTELNLSMGDLGKWLGVLRGVQLAANRGSTGGV